MDPIWSRKALHLAVDIEALASAPTAIIATIGVVLFDPFRATPSKEPPTWYKRIDMRDNDQRERTADRETVHWWNEQSTAAQRELYGKDERMPLRAALIELQGGIEYFKLEHKRETGCEEICIWSVGANYDSSILLHAFKQYGIKAPWAFRDAMDARTLRHVAGSVEVDKTGLTPHHALDDARLCARRVTAQLAQLKALTL